MLEVSCLGGKTPSAACSMLVVQQQKRLCRVANSSTCPRHDKFATQCSAQCRSTWHTADNRCMKFWNIYRRVSQKRDVNQHALYCILSATGNQCNSRRAGVTRSCGMRLHVFMINRVIILPNVSSGYSELYCQRKARIRASQKSGGAERDRWAARLSKRVVTRNSSEDEIANVNFLYDDISYTHYKIQYTRR